uniref:Immunoglobulin V-set domain-containing protein n=1 Tax=Naja naja TaxID=35670 RepID=A0A8C6XFP9_NAJNA
EALWRSYLGLAGLLEHSGGQNHCPIFASSGTVGWSFVTSRPNNGLTDTCWGRSCPSLGSCPNKMISINKNLKIDGQLQKYYLKGNVSQGDVSLTIANITEDDVGTYCCRVEYEGWFNDGKMLFKLLIKEGE